MFFYELVSDTRGDKKFSPLHLNLENKQITNPSYNVSSSNFIMLKMKIFGAGKKRYLTKMNKNPLLVQVRRIKYILAHVIIL